VLLDDLEGLGAEEAEVGWLAHFLIFFALGNPSTFTVAADCPTPSPHPAWACLSPALAEE
jgi:hypothetical protein